MAKFFMNSEFGGESMTVYETGNELVTLSDHWKDETNSIWVFGDPKCKVEGWEYECHHGDKGKYGSWGIGKHNEDALDRQGGGNGMDGEIMCYRMKSPE